MKIFFVSLGCDKNKVDSEKVLDFFIKKYSAELVTDIKDADVCMVNSCAFIGDAKNESINYLKYINHIKNKNCKVVLLGCLAKEYELNKNNIKCDLKKICDYILPVDKYLYDLNSWQGRIFEPISFVESLKISDGCNKNCTYCIIPKLRGVYKSNTIENLYNEVKLLTMSGTRELNIVGQDILNYGIDIYKKKSLPNLIDKISEIQDLKWIRLLYCYPEEIDDSVIELIKNNKKVLHYIDMPIQHINYKILKMMNRRTTKENIMYIINKLRSHIPDIVIRTTFIVGFPGENEDSFNELIDFIKEVKFDKVGCFTYSREKLSASYDLKNQVDEKTKKYRQKKLIDIQKKIVIFKNIDEINKEYEVIVEGFNPKNKMYVARNYKNARDIDDLIYIKTNNKLSSGQFVNVKIESFDEYDLIAKIV